MTFLGEIIVLYWQYFENLMPSFNTDTENKASVFKMQLTTGQRIFVVKTYCKTSSYLEVN